MNKEFLEKTAHEYMINRFKDEDYPISIREIKDACEEDFKAGVKWMLKSIPLYNLIPWPEVQKYMDKEGFDDNAYLLDYVEDLNNPVYAITVKWLKENED